MTRILQGIALILFSLLLMTLGIADPNLPLIGPVGKDLYPLVPLAVGIAGLVMVFHNKK